MASARPEVGAEPDEAASLGTPGTSPWGRTARRVLHHPGGVFGLVVILALLVCALFTPLLTHQSPYAQNLLASLLPPGPGHLLGTDEFGRDELARVLYGSRTALEIGLVVIVLAMAGGVTMGLVAGLRGGWVDNALMRTVDVLMAFPYLLLALMIVAALGPGLRQAIIAVAIVYVPSYARLVRAVMLSLREREFVSAARSMGASDARLMWRHFLPNLAAPLLVQVTLNIGTAIIDVAGLGFLGLGAQPPAADWGAMLSDGQNYTLEAAWLSLFPGLAIFLVVIAFNLLGDALRDAMDPKSGRAA